MSKGSNGTRSLSPIHAISFEKIGNGNAEITDNIDDYTLPSSVVNKIDAIKNIHSYNDIKQYLQKYGIKVTTDIETLNNGEAADSRIETIESFGQKLVTGIETYRAVFGKDALSKLKMVKLYDKQEPSKAAYYFNTKGEHDPKAGTIRFQSWNATGREIFHELAHAMQDSKAKAGEDALLFSDRITGVIGKGHSGYIGRGGNTENAENMADSLGYAFTERPNTNYINKLRSAIRR